MRVFFLFSFSDLSHHRTCGSAYGGSLLKILFYDNNPLRMDSWHALDCRCSMRDEV